MSPDPADDMRLQRAFELRKKYYNELALFAVRLGCSKFDAQQVANDSLIDLAMREHGPNSEPIKNERAWLYGAVRNRARGLFRHHRRYVPVRDFQPETLVEAGITPEKYVELMELLDAIRKLPERHRVPLALVLAEWSYADIADALDSTVDSAKQRVCRARKALRRKLGV